MLDWLEIEGTDQGFRTKLFGRTSMVSTSMVQKKLLHNVPMQKIQNQSHQN